MATVADLDRLEALIALLTPLSKVQPGQPVTADAWNTLVSTIIELARNIVTHEQDQSVASHTHEEQVALSWLDLRLRSLVEDGPLSDPTSVRRVLTLERKIDQVAGRTDEAHANIGEVRTRLSEVATRDLVREASLTTVGRKVEAMADGKDDVLTLRRTLDTIKDQVKTAADAAAKFTINGAIADLEAMNSRLKSVEELKTRLTTAKGDLLDAMEIEKKFTELGNRSISKKEFSEVLAGKLPPDLIPDIHNLKADVTASLQETLKIEQERATLQVKTDVLNSLPDFNSMVAHQVSENVSKTVNDALENVKNQIPGLIDSKLAGSWQTMVNQQVSSALSASKADFVRQATSSVVEQLKLQYKDPVFEDNLLQIIGVGEKYNIKLINAGIHTYQALASKSAEELGKIMGLAPQRIIALHIIEQAAALAGRHG